MKQETKYRAFHPTWVAPATHNPNSCFLLPRSGNKVLTWAASAAHNPNSSFLFPRSGNKLLKTAESKF
jgi:hypothetical protein